MKLATLTIDDGTCAAVFDGEDYVLIESAVDVGSLLSGENWQTVAAEALTHRKRVIPAEQARVDQLITRPGKVVCVGLNYRNHILEMGRDLPEYPTLFAKFAETLTGPTSDIPFAPEDPELDWEGELVVIVGETVRRADERKARAAIAGYSVANDISMRGWQFRTKEWLQGKMWEATTPLGPVMVTADEFDAESAVLTTKVNGEVMQEHAISDLLFSSSQLVAYVSTMITLEPGDIILTGTPGGVGRARDPQVFLVPGDEVAVEISGIGEVRNTIVEAV
ncbi:fumarylacetoacetate hydrolase family protein [Brevibacterium atlanticum]|uniref:fumarylacetoacetate hydrolase family protein n=1 Tax=Brevibacterium atlanticum TaxID=2697563 RepID=UPI00142356DE|nr:fumarylacetoacetate hydrolase family protein [Brevibacterium atlanticum]